MKFAHLADLHIGGWNDERLRKLSTDSFLWAINYCIKEKVDFVLFAGDLFHTSLPAIDKLKIVADKLRKLKDANIPIYIIAGSHDFSPTGKTMIEVFDKAGLVINVCKGQIENNTLKLKFIEDPKTKVKITGMIGKKGMLEKKFYNKLDYEHLEKEPGKKIFLFHTTLTQLKPDHLKDIDSEPISILPKHFDYYAGGHVHSKIIHNSETHKTITYPGPLFPNNFQELEKLSQGGFFIFENNNLNWIPIKLKQHKKIFIQINKKTPEQVEETIIDELDKIDVKDKLITIRVQGELEKGYQTDIKWPEILEGFYKKGAYIILKNTKKLKSPEFSEVKKKIQSNENIESEIIKEHLEGEIKILEKDEEEKLIQNIFELLSKSKQEGETIYDFEKRINDEVNCFLEGFDLV